MRIKTKTGFFIKFVSATMVLFLSFVLPGAMCGHDSGHIDRVFAADSVQKVVPVAAGEDYSLAVDKDGTVWAWGRNSYNQLGLGRASSDSVASVGKVAEITNVVAVTGGDHHTIALKKDGTVWGWGNNAGGQLGDSNRITQKPYSTMTPVKTKNLEGIVEVKAGKAFTLALKNDGTIWTWGTNVYGYLGNGTDSDRPEPEMLQGFDDVTAIGTGIWHGMMVRSDGTVWTWGKNSSGCLGYGTTITRSNVPVQVMYMPDKDKPEELIPLTGVKSVDGGLEHSIALKHDGTVWGWGFNIHGQLGNGTWTNSHYPTQVANLANITKIAAGSGFNLALRSDGTVWVWGQGQKGEHGQLTEPTGGIGPDGKPTTGYTYLSANHHHLDRNVPVQIQGLKNITAIAAGNHHGIAVDKDGLVWTWGNNGHGQIGNSVSSNYGYPISNPLTYLGGGAANKLNTIMQPSEADSPAVTSVNRISEPSSWAAADIEAAKGYRLTTPKVLSDYQSPVTREEFCELAVRLYEVLSGQQAVPAQSNTFSDTKNQEILKAYNLGIVSGVGGGLFAPAQQVTREQIAVMFYRTMKAAKPDLQLTEASYPTYIDAEQIEGWASEAVTEMSAREIITGTGAGLFAPKGSATREQAIVLTKRVFEQLK